MAFLTAALLVVISVLGSNAQSEPPIVDLGYASYQGTFDSSTNVTNFFGVRYATPPLGEFCYLYPHFLLIVIYLR